MSDTPCTLEPRFSLPFVLRAGDQLAWNVQTENLDPASLLFYTLTAIVGNLPVRQLIGTIPTGTPPAGGIPLTNGVAAFTLTSAQTDAWAPGRYQWVLFAVDSTGNRTELAQGKIRIDPDPAGAAPADPRTENEIMLHQIRCVLKDRTATDVQSYKIGGREMVKMTVKELLDLEGTYAARVRKERERRGEKVRTKTVGILFGGR